MNNYSKKFRMAFLAMLVLAIVSMPGAAYCQGVSGLSESGGGIWSYRSSIVLTEPIGLPRVNEPVEVTLKSDKAKPQGEDIRITDANNNEVPSQVEAQGDGTYEIYFLAQCASSSSNTYYVYYGNPNAEKPNYETLNSVLDNQNKSWQTDGVYIKWGEKAFTGNIDTNVITTLKFDHDQDNNPANDLDCLTDEITTFYGYLGTNISSNPADFGASQAQLVKSGPVFCQVALGNASVRYYKGQNWIMTNGFADCVYCFDRNYQFAKNGLGDEMFIPSWDSGQLEPWLSCYYSASVNPQYLAFRNPNDGLIFGGVAKNVASWEQYAKYPCAWDRIIRFIDSSNLPDEKIYWYADTSNSYTGIDQFSKQMLNPLKVDLHVDTEPPVTCPSVSPENPDGLNGWYVNPPSVSLSVNEASTTFYRLDSEGYKEYGSAINIPEGIHELCYYSVDWAGNKEQEKSLQIKVDCGQPEIEAGISPSRVNNRYVAGEEITPFFSASDSISGVAAVDAIINGTPVLSGDKVSFDKAGEYALVITATDVAGNKTTKTQIFNVGYNSKWLPPIQKRQGLKESPYQIKYGSTLPLKFSVSDYLGNFVSDNSVHITITDGTNLATFIYGDGNGYVKIDPSDENYLLNLRPKDYSWIKPGGTYTVSVYFGSSIENSGVAPGILQDQIQLEVN